MITRVKQPATRPWPSAVGSVVTRYREVFAHHETAPLNGATAIVESVRTSWYCFACPASSPVGVCRGGSKMVHFMPIIPG